VDNLVLAAAADQQAERPRAKWIATLTFRLRTPTAGGPCRPFGPLVWLRRSRLTDRRRVCWRSRGTASVTLRSCIHPQPGGGHGIGVSGVARAAFSRCGCRFFTRHKRGYDQRHTRRCDRSHWGRTKDRAGQEGLMASHPMGPGSAVPPSEWHSSAHEYARGQMMACLRAGVIALVLLGILALIVLF
jgi:hypothetical protein